MRCSKARALISLSESDDLTAAESRRLADHVAGCTGCRRLEAADPLPFAALRTSVPLRGEHYAAVRARVLAGLASDRRLPLFTPFRLATALVLSALVGIGAFLMNRPAVEGLATPEIVETTTPFAMVEPRAAVDAAPPDEAPPSIAHAEPRVAPPIPHAAPARTAATEPQSAVAALETPEELRIQIQTNDPAIRIIWIVNPSHVLEPTSLEEKS
jgi:hypothetical protein